ncbi:hypothetical protein GF361_02510 [Candidatus Woesearchaeota archaeon]|nr:hypothetical protein [Candidatus Woesearchaeota archaeon]
MKITHKINRSSISMNTKKDSENLNFLLTNKLGGYCMLSSAPSSKYQGVFMMHKEEMYKIIEDISPVNSQNITEITNSFSFIKRKRKSLTEKFFMPYGYDALVYELNKQSPVKITLDMRASYSNPEFGREYRISKTGSKIIIRYQHEKTKLYLAIKPDKEKFEKIEKWIKRSYKHDQKRNSPHEKYVYKALKLDASKIVFAFSKKRKQAIEEADYVYKNLKRLKDHQKIYVNNINTKKTRNKKTKIAKKCAINSLNKLVINLKNKRGIFAGLPWFFQFWSRDELISLKALLLNKQNREVKDILIKNLKIIKYGKLPNLSFPRSDSSNADSIGWFFKRIDDSLDIFSKKEKEKISKKLAASIKHINKNHLRNKLVHNNPNETWMDTEWDSDNREGFRIEIQALFLNMLKLAYKLTKDKKYMHQEKELKNKVKAKFWNGKMLADGLGDFTVRPNVFIAAYIYPDLLTKTEWTSCFKNILPKLWLGWGGFSSIDKSHHLYCSDYTGESDQSYHRGDSWFWINNLAALVMVKTNKTHFKKYIKKILDASTEEILTSGALGHHAEVSSSSKLRSEGCLAQAWSDAMFIELIEEV